MRSGHAGQSSRQRKERSERGVDPEEGPGYSCWAKRDGFCTRRFRYLAVGPVEFVELSRAWIAASILARSHSSLPDNLVKVHAGEYTGS